MSDNDYMTNAQHLINISGQYLTIDQVAALAQMDGITADHENGSWYAHDGDTHASGPLTITITIDMAHDLTEAGIVADDAKIAAAEQAWITAAEQIAAARGYEATISAAVNGSPEATWTVTDAGDGPSIEQQIWQAAHDAISTTIR